MNKHLPAEMAGVSPKPPGSIPNISTMDWRELQSTVENCRECRLCESRTQAVFGEGAMRPPVMFIGEGPGRHEDLSGRPFVGRAGKILDQMIKTMRFKRSEIFIGNVVKCRPPGNRNPQENEVLACLPYLNRQIDILQPRIIVTLGAVSLFHLLGLTGISKVRGNFYQYRNIPTVPTYHPSYLLRARRKEKDVREDLRKVMLHVGKDPAETVSLQLAITAGKPESHPK